MRYLVCISSVLLLGIAAYGQSPISAELSSQRATVNVTLLHWLKKALILSHVFRLL